MASEVAIVLAHQVWLRLTVTAAAVLTVLIIQA
jgi:hypothetical protein